MDNITEKRKICKKCNCIESDINKFEILLLCNTKVFLPSLIILFDSEIKVFFACVN